ncbi:hypothetical protein BDA96_02G427700 [Sorghum bicolor]|uniref:Uncharacterized protein n=1 Tax=Sorghum bicolor TaxID=4558 RepID=A0A921UVD9_SORBI|nr:hypothetical protein BDA96_02G427700 [Sorghum bicolor]KAG0546204.1 hypothetical protein BDA96_02G427700 [Sorghum bicolor]
MASAVHPPPPLALLPRPRVVDAVADDDMDDSDSESVAESCPHPCPHGAGAAATDSSYSSCGSSVCCHEDDEAEMDEDDDDDGCSSCVEGDEYSSYQEQDETAGDEEGRNKAGTRRSGAWWEQMAVAGVRGGAITALPLAPAPEAAEDPKRVAERQEEDRKFWEDCLASGQLLLSETPRSVLSVSDESVCSKKKQ